MLQGLNEKTKVSYNRRRGHVYVDIPIVYEGSTNTAGISFIYDTGAYMTVINREMYEFHKLDKLTRKPAKMGGYVGATPGFIFQIPGLIIGDKLLRMARKFTDEFKKDAVRLSNEIGCQEASDKLDISVLNRAGFKISEIHASLNNLFRKKFLDRNKIDIYTETGLLDAEETLKSLLELCATKLNEEAEISSFYDAINKALAQLQVICKNKHHPDSSSR